jgi:hypothetical protein
MLITAHVVYCATDVVHRACRWWHFGLLIWEYMKQKDVKPGKFGYDEMCTLLEAAVSLRHL